MTDDEPYTPSYRRKLGDFNRHLREVAELMSITRSQVREWYNSGELEKGYPNCYKLLRDSDPAQSKGPEVLPSKEYGF